MRMELQLLEAMALHILELEVEDCHRLLEVVVVTLMVAVDSGEQVEEEAANYSGQVGAGMGMVEGVNCR